MWSSPFFPRIKPITHVSRLKALSRVRTTVNELYVSVDGVIFGSS